MPSPTLARGARRRGHLHHDAHQQPQVEDVGAARAVQVHRPVGTARHDGDDASHDVQHVDPAVFVQVDPCGDDRPGDGLDGHHGLAVACSGHHDRRPLSTPLPRSVPPASPSVTRHRRRRVPAGAPWGGKTRSDGPRASGASSQDATCPCRVGSGPPEMARAVPSTQPRGARTPERRRPTCPPVRAPPNRRALRARRAVRSQRSVVSSGESVRWPRDRHVTQGVRDATCAQAPSMPVAGRCRLIASSAQPTVGGPRTADERRAPSPRVASRWSCAPQGNVVGDPSRALRAGPMRYRPMVSVGASP